MSFSSRGKTPSISILAKGGSFLTGNFLKPLKLDVVFDSYSSGFNRLLTNFRYIGSFAISNGKRQGTLLPKKPGKISDLVKRNLMVNMATAYSTGYLANGQLDKGGCHNHIPVLFLLSLSENLSTPSILGPRLYYIVFHFAKEPIS